MTAPTLVDVARQIATVTPLSEAAALGILGRLNTGYAWSPERQQTSAKLVLGYSQMTVDLLEPRIEDIRIQEIAHNLSHICRFNGSTAQPYSVAAHSVFVSKLVRASGGAAWACLAGLLHDATEAYLGDVSGPLKRSGYVDGYRELEDRWGAVIGRFAGLPLGALSADRVKYADLQALAFEMLVLMKHTEPEWQRPTSAQHVLFDECPPFGPAAAREFVLQFRELTVEMRLEASTTVDG